MPTIWKLSQDGNSASRTLDNGSVESRLVIAIPADELATALPADPLTQAELRAPLVASAQALLDKSDISVTRILAKAIPVPADINAYRDALRAIVNGTDTTSTSLPTAPTDYPTGT